MIPEPKEYRNRYSVYGLQESNYQARQEGNRVAEPVATNIVRMGADAVTKAAEEAKTLYEKAERELKSAKGAWQWAEEENLHLVYQAAYYRTLAYELRVAAERFADPKENLAGIAVLAQHFLRDETYKTVRNGRVEKWSGEAVIVTASGKYRCTGYGPQGDAWTVVKHGGIEVTPI